MTVSSPSLSKSKDTITYDRRIVAIRKTRNVLRGRKDAQGNAVLEQSPEELHIVFEDSLVLIQEPKAVHPNWWVGATIRFTLQLSPDQGEQS